MQEISFSIPVSGTVRIDENTNTVTITVNKAETTVTFETPPKEERVALPKGTTIFDVLLQTAQHLVGSDGQRRLTTAELYHEALRQYPQLRRNTWAAHVIASTPSHPSYRHHSSQRDYFDFMGSGTYRLNPRYLIADSDSSEEEKDGQT